MRTNRSQHIRTEHAAYAYLLAQTGATPHRANRRKAKPRPAFGTNEDPLAWGLVLLCVLVLACLA